MTLPEHLARRWWRGLRSLSPNCQETSRLQSDAMDRLLPWPHRIGLRIHLLLCRGCRRYGRQLRFLRQTVHQQPDGFGEAPSPTLSQDAKERLQEALRSAK